MIRIAKDSALRAGREIIGLRKKGLVFKKKQKRGDFATQADIASEKIILNLLMGEFPNHNFVSEEKGKINNRSEYTWFIDPIDGTIPFSSGMPSFGVSVGLVRGNKTYLGVINLPALECLLWAERDKGAYLNGERIFVSRERELLKSIVGFEFGYIGTRNTEVKKLLGPILDKVRYTPILGSTAVGVSYVANGCFDGYLHSAHPWDFAAGAIIVEEAGGRVTDFKGGPVDWAKDWMDVFASNGLIHNKVLKLISRG